MEVKFLVMESNYYGRYVLASGQPSALTEMCLSTCPYVQNKKRLFRALIFTETCVTKRSLSPYSFVFGVFTKIVWLRNNNWWRNVLTHKRNYSLIRTRLGPSTSCNKSDSKASLNCYMLTLAMAMLGVRDKKWTNKLIQFQASKTGEPRNCYAHCNVLITSQLS